MWSVTRSRPWTEAHMRIALSVPSLAQPSDVMSARSLAASAWRYPRAMRAGINERTSQQKISVRNASRTTMSSDAASMIRSERNTNSCSPPHRLSSFALVQAGPKGLRFGA